MIARYDYQMIDLRILFGVGGVATHDTPLAHHWAHRLRWPMTVIALLALPALWFDLSPPEVIWHHLGRVLDGLILLAFSAELLWMMHVSRQPLRYALRNWLDLIIIIAAAASLFGIEEQWLALSRLMRVVWASLLLARTLAMARELFRATVTLWILAAGAIMLALVRRGVLLAGTDGAQLRRRLMAGFCHRRHDRLWRFCADHHSVTFFCNVRCSTWLWHAVANNCLNCCFLHRRR
jgi:hypothetical protein